MKVHKHKIVKIIRSHTEDGLTISEIEMDCPVMPMKMLVTKVELKEGEKFDPHFSNEDVVARLRPTLEGWNNGIEFIHSPRTKMYSMQD